MADSSMESDQLQAENVGADLNLSGDAIGNAPLMGSVGQSPKVNSPSGDSVSATEDGTSGKNSPTVAGVKCDDCSRPEPIRLWRWCRGCERVLCETCSVEGHYAHSIESYASAVRRSDEEHRQAMEEVRSVVDKLTEGAKVAEELQVEIVAKLNAVTREMHAKIGENKDVEATLAEHLAAMERLKEEPLNAKTWFDRNQFMAGLEKLMKTAFDKQKETDEYVKNVDASVDESGRKMGEIFREDH